MRRYKPWRLIQNRLLLISRLWLNYGCLRLAEEGRSTGRETDPGALSGYSSWKEVTGYFDGDGNVGLQVVKRVLRFRIRFVDTWSPQVESISRFLEKRRINSGNVGRDNKEVWQAAYRLDTSEVNSVLRTAKVMIRYSVKKGEDLKIAIDYLERRVTGIEAIAAFNEEVREGRRRGKVRKVDLPHTREVGLRLVNSRTLATPVRPTWSM